jgi:anti-anti-sigma factor
VRVTIDDSAAGLTRVTLEGDLDVAGCAAASAPFTQDVVARRESAVIDLSRVAFIASLGMGLLVSTAKALHRFGKRLVLLRPQSLVEDALEAAGLDEILPIAKDEGAVERLLRA